MEELLNMMPRFGNPQFQNENIQMAKGYSTLQETRRSANRESSFEGIMDQEDGRTSEYIDYASKREDGGS